jgi:hypothetical protein
VKQTPTGGTVDPSTGVSSNVERHDTWSSWVRRNATSFPIWQELERVPTETVGVQKAKSRNPGAASSYIHTLQNVGEAGHDQRETFRTITDSIASKCPVVGRDLGVDEVVGERN